jgi:NB-ARC domain
MGGLRKTTACKILANDTKVRNKIHEGIFWIEFGHNTAADGVIDQLVHVTELSGGFKTSATISEACSNRFERAKSCFQRWFENRAVLFVVDNIWPSNDQSFRKWVSILRDVTGSKSVVSHSSRTPLGKTNIPFLQLDEREQRAIFLCHMTEDSEAYKSNISSIVQILKGCAGLPLALAVAAALMQNDPNGWESLSSRLGHDLMNPANCLLWDHPGLAYVIETSLEWLCDQKVQVSDCSLRWDELYFSIAVLDRACPSAPVGVLAPMWGLSIPAAEEVCRTFVKSSLATLSGGEAAKRTIMLHDLQFQYCSERCKGTGSSASIRSEPAWHEKVIEALAMTHGAPLDQIGLPRIPADTAFAGLPARSVTADDVCRRSWVSPRSRSPRFMNTFLRIKCVTFADTKRDFLRWQGVF